MVFPVTISDSPLEFDSLAALKCRVWQPGAHRVYTMARLYLLNGDLQASFSAFERKPLPGSAILLRVGGQDAALHLCLTPEKAALLCGGAAPLPADVLAQGSAVEARRFSGVDEQGWYWGAGLTVSGAALARAGIQVAPGVVFAGVLAKYQNGLLMGASCAAGAAGQFSLVEF